MLIVDASCLYEVVADTTQAEQVRRRMAADRDHAAPHVIDAEVLGIIRRDRMLGRLDDTAARQAMEDLRDWPAERFGHRMLLAAPGSCGTEYAPGTHSMWHWPRRSTRR